MNRFGIRLAAGLAVICLGSLAILQAQQDKNETVDTEWPSAKVASSDPPAPLGIVDDWPAPPDTDHPPTLVRGNDDYEAPPVNQFTNPIQLSSYEQPAEGPSKEFDSGETIDDSYDPGAYANFSPALMSPPESPADTESPVAGPVSGGFSMPAIEVPGMENFAADDVTPIEPADVPEPIGLAPLPVMQDPASLASDELSSLPPIGSGFDPAASPVPAPIPNGVTAIAVLSPVEQAATNWQAPVETQPAPTAPATYDTAIRVASNEPVATTYAPPMPLLQTIDASEILSEPGTRDLEGAQSPSVLVQKRAPAEVRVGKPAEFTISVKNVGTVTALDVRVFDTVPEGSSLKTTQPKADQVQNLLVWQLGDLRPGEERALTVTVVPQQEGELGSVARVTFEAAASVRTMATQPVVALNHSVPTQVLIGQQLEMDLEVNNTGTGSAEDVYVLAELPDGLETSNGQSLKLPIGMMPPGDTRRHLLRMRATKPGPLSGTLQLVDADGVISNATIDVEVIAPRLEVALDGPSMRYLERQATYKVQIANSGTADANDIDLVAYLDRGLKFVSTDFEGSYDPSRHAVSWALDELKANEVGEVPLTLLPVEPGVQKVRLETTGAMGIAANFEREITIDTLAELSFTITDSQDPIEPGAESVYEVRVQNKGTREDTQVVLDIQIPHPGMQLVSAEPAAGTDGNGRVIFEPIAKIAAKGEQIYQIRVRGVSPDTHVIRATVVSQQSKRPVTKEESTTVYADQ